ncbi:hypothetical protein FRX31_006859 [Thalictrum thalictroides]|uniref:SKP1 component dimerisation domain-containing protein n=1 Tax=Thalictrum thalictroides TaxID=46969 RepID=A0A7J6X2J6_THATH|nr:hypothetical protein FRX31_006859 [Thalictrum thalictroides]
MMNNTSDDKDIELDLTHLPHINQAVVDSVISYLENYLLPDQEKQTFVETLFTDYKTDGILGILGVANFLEIPDLITVALEKIQNIMADRSVEEIAKEFGVKDYTPQEVDEARVGARPTANP